MIKYFLIKSESFINPDFWVGEPNQNLIRITEDEGGNFWQAYYSIKHENFMFQTGIRTHYPEKAKIQELKIDKEDIKKLVLSYKLRK